MELINSFAVVVYLQGSLARFVESLRGTLKPGDLARAHLTLLPPRALAVPPREAVTALGRIVVTRQPFEVSPGEVSAFEDTQVITLSIANGHSKLLELHQALNSGPFRSVEEHDYAPHITLGLKVGDERFQQGLQVARRRWAEFGPVDPVRVEILALVQQAGNQSWHDIGQARLGVGPAAD